MIRTSRQTASPLVTERPPRWLTAGVALRNLQGVSGGPEGNWHAVTRSHYDWLADRGCGHVRVVLTPETYVEDWHVSRVPETVAILPTTPDTSTWGAIVASMRAAQDAGLGLIVDGFHTPPLSASKILRRAGGRAHFVAVWRALLEALLAAGLDPSRMALELHNEPQQWWRPIGTPGRTWDDLDSLPADQALQIARSNDANWLTYDAAVTADMLQRWAEAQDAAIEAVRQVVPGIWCTVCGLGYAGDDDFLALPVMRNRHRVLARTGFYHPLALTHCASFATNHEWWSRQVHGPAHALSFPMPLERLRAVDTRLRAVYGTSYSGSTMAAVIGQLIADVEALGLDVVDERVVEAAWLASRERMARAQVPFWVGEYGIERHMAGVFAGPNHTHGFLGLDPESCGRWYDAVTPRIRAAGLPRTHWSGRESFGTFADGPVTFDLEDEFAVRPTTGQPWAI